MAYRDFEDDEFDLRLAEADAPPSGLHDHPVIEVINILAVALLEILGPFCWLALILLFLVAEFSPG
jgi:hypothetical protein